MPRAAPAPLARVPAQGLFVLGALAQYLGSSLAVLLFDVVPAPGLAWLRVISAAAALADKLRSLTEFISQRFPSIPIIFGHAVFDRNDRILISPALPKRNHFITREFAAIGFFENVRTTVVKLTGGRVERQQNVTARFVSGLINRLKNRFDCFVI